MSGDAGLTRCRSSSFRRRALTEPLRPDNGDHPPQDHAGENAQALEHALANLQRAASSRLAERICSAYADVRKRLAGATVGEVLGRVKQSLGPQADMILVWAYSHRHCFMCDAGMVPCDQCDGEGVTETDRVCPSCDGFGITDCSFCRGTGWADHETIPPELRTAVRRSHFLIVQQELARLKQETRELTGRFRHMDKQNRRRIGSWLMRLSARLAHLEQQAKAAHDVSNQTAFGAAVSEVDSLLQQLAGLAQRR